MGHIQFLEDPPVLVDGIQNTDMNKLFCDSIERPSFCAYGEYDPVICCSHCDKKEECWVDQETSEERVPCLGQNIDNIACELRF